MSKFSLQREIKRIRRELDEELKALGELMVSVDLAAASILHKRGYLRGMEAEFVQETYSGERKDETQG
ncbi:hypothetical protein LCGC14_0442750 [marine sediment metagenome]|uniref:Uncharacterized protein n=1 Tax=marine sediment metagenome TaxID=412755 RepID=A0A0F9SK01_9ZZZZ